MSSEAFSHVLNHSERSGGMLLVLLTLAEYSDNDWEVSVPVAVLAHRSRMSVRRVQRAVAALCELGDLTVEIKRGKDGQNLYRLQRPAADMVSPVTPSAPLMVSVVTPSLPRTREHGPKYNNDSERKASSRTRVRPPATRQRNELWDALVTATGICPATLNERSRFARSVALIREAGGTPNMVVSAAHVYMGKYPGAALTDTAMANRWGELTVVSASGSGYEKCPDCGTLIKRNSMRDHRYQTHDVGVPCLECDRVNDEGEVCRCQAR